MQVIINGEQKSLKSSATVSDIISNLNIEGKIAVEVNKEILPRSQFDQYQVCDGDVLEIVRAIGGG